ncbi:MAG TPA: AMP-binding protein [Aeromicrobium sp.]|nr:AMP-binding protein [Aeromicrobium sp.]
MAVNLSEYLHATAVADPEGVALVEVSSRAGSSRRSLSWADVDSAADAVARALTGRGLVAGQRVALVMANRADLPIAYFGILRGGMVAVPMNPRSTADEIQRMLADAKVKLVLCDATGVAQVREAAGEHLCDIVVDGADPIAGETSFNDFIGEATDVEPAAPRDAEALAAILYTSGASGHPRGVMLSHRALIANVEQAAAVEPPLVAPDDCLLGLLPMFHIYGLNAVLGTAMRVGARVVMVDGFDPEGLLATVRDEGITYLPLAPPVIAAWAGRDGVREALAGVRVVVSGASPLDAELAALFAESSGHHVEQGYGMTEASPVIAVTLASRRGPGSAPKPGSVGHSLPGIEVRTVDSHGNDVENGDLGELLVHGDNLFSGYWPDGADGPDADGWYRTGDVGFADDDGDLTLVDRLRELVIVSGFNVYPSEVEDVIHEVAGVAEVAVVGVPDEATGEGVVAFVVPAADAPSEDELTDAINAHCRDRLARFKHPSRVVVVGDLPHSATGKVAKGRLRALARGEALNLDPS